MYQGISFRTDKGKLKMSLAPRILDPSIIWGRVADFTVRQLNPGSHRVGDWVSPRAYLDEMAKEKNISPGLERNPSL
jgi:hypothetical protein